MKTRTLLAAAFIMAAPIAAISQSPFTSLHPEAAYPDPRPEISQHAYSDLIIGLQERLNAQGFDAGPPNGDFGAKTQAALAQFQLSRAIPASGQLDDSTLAELGLNRTPPQASAGPSAEPQADAPAPQPDTSAPAEKPGS